MKPTSSSPGPGRRLTEKNRRQQMRDLYRRLASLVSRENTLRPVKGQVQHSVAKNHSAVIDEGSQFESQQGAGSWWYKDGVVEKSPASDLLGEATNFIKQLEENVNELKAKKDSLQLPIVIIGVNESERGESLEINIVCGSENKKLKMHKVFCILKEEGAEIVSAYNSTVGLKIYHTILCKAFSPRLGMDINRVQQRLKNFISSI